MTRTVVKALFGIAFMALRASAAEPPSVPSVAPENSSAPAHPAEPPPVSIRRVGPPPRENLPDIHPAVLLLDDAGNRVLHSGRPLSLMRSWAGATIRLSLPATITIPWLAWMN